MKYSTEILFFGGIIIAVVICLCILLFCGKYPTDNIEDKSKIMAIKKRNIWIRTSVIWLALYYWLVLNSVLTTLIVLYISCYRDMTLESMQIRVFMYSALSLFSAICPYIVNMLDVSKAYRSAFRGLDNAINLKGDLAKAICEGEEMIAKVHK